MKKFTILLLLFLWITPNTWAEGAAPDQKTNTHQYASCQYHAKKMQRMDQNNDGQVSRQEFLAAAKKRAERIFAKKDTNQDGLMSKEEMLGQNKK